jgi:glycosyltransferase involved in cell wall biosynthesis
MDDASFPRCTVLLCTRRRTAHLDRCLQALAGLAYPNFDVLVVDNTCGDDETQKVAARWNVRCVAAPRGGLSHARNYGTRMTNAEIIAYIDDDALPEAKWLDALVAQFGDPLVMAVAGRANFLGPVSEGAPSCFSPGCADGPVGERLAVDRQTPGWFELATSGSIGQGMNMAFRRRAFDVWPGFDERLGRGAALWGAEEHYAFFSLIDRGYRVVYTPEAVVSHPLLRAEREYRRHQIADTIALTAYLTLLLVEEPGYRTALLKFCWKALRRDPLRKRRRAGIPNMIPRWALPLLWLCGPVLYVRSLFGRSREGTAAGV